MYLALFSGVGISIAGASNLRTSLLILCVATLLFLALRRLKEYLVRCWRRMPIDASIQRKCPLPDCSPGSF
jgi:hypothetical protein